MVSDPAASKLGVVGAITTTGDDNDHAVLDVAWALAQFEQQDRFPIDVLTMVPGHEDINYWDSTGGANAAARDSSFVTHPRKVCS